MPQVIWNIFIIRSWHLLFNETMCPCLFTIVVVLNQHYKYCVEMPSKDNYQHWMQRDGILDNWKCISMSWMVKMSLIETTYFFDLLVQRPNVFVAMSFPLALYLCPHSSFKVRKMLHSIKLITIIQPSKNGNNIFTYTKVWKSCSIVDFPSHEYNIILYLANKICT